MNEATANVLHVTAAAQREFGEDQVVHGHRRWAGGEGLPKHPGAEILESELKEILRGA